MEGTITEEEEKGIEAIQFLQKMVNIDESHDKALAGWRGMSSSEKKTTMHVYGLMKKK